MFSVQGIFLKNSKYKTYSVFKINSNMMPDDLQLYSLVVAFVFPILLLP